MSIVDEIQSERTEDIIKDAVNTVVDAEREDAEWKHSGAGKNTHFEFKFGSGDERVHVYIERLDTDTGVEVMVWADVAYFEGVEEDWLDVSDGGDTLAEFVTLLQEYVQESIPGEHYPNMEHREQKGDSIIFNDFYYL